MDLKRYRNPPKLLVTQPEKPKHEEKQAENLLSLFDLQMSVKRKKYLGGIR